MTWPGGSKAVDKGDWSPLAGRALVIWPDADSAGRDAAKAVERRAKAAGPAFVAIVALPEGLPAGWDLADDWPPGLDPAEAAAAVADAFAARFLAFGAREPEPPVGPGPDLIWTAAGRLTHRSRRA